MRFSSLDQWLSWQEGLHTKEIDLGLDRVRQVLTLLDLPPRPAHQVITVAGTNGKGSSCAMLEAIYLAAGYRVGTYTSPHLLRYNERIRFNGEQIDDEQLCQVFEQIDQARGDISLSYFEFGTLAAIVAFAQTKLDVAIMEVGLGGRLDAVNVLNADVALITAISVDHEAWLGRDRNLIGREKAGIMRAGSSVVCGDIDAPPSIAEVAAEVGAPLYLQGQQFGAEKKGEHWRWWSGDKQRDALLMPALRGDFQLYNAAAVLQVIDLAAKWLPVSQAAVREGLANVSVPGRFQVIPGPVPIVLDVAHNPQSALALSQTLHDWGMPGKTVAIVAMMADKDIDAIVAALAPEIDEWCVTSIDIPRAAPVQLLVDSLERVGATELTVRSSVEASLEHVMASVKEHDRVIVFGSFYTVAEVLASNYNIV